MQVDEELGSGVHVAWEWPVYDAVKGSEIDCSKDAEDPLFEGAVSVFVQ